MIFCAKSHKKTLTKEREEKGMEAFFSEVTLGRAAAAPGQCATKAEARLSLGWATGPWAPGRRSRDQQPLAQGPLFRAKISMRKRPS